MSDNYSKVWIDAVLNSSSSSSLADPVLLEVFWGAKELRAFSNLTDEEVKQLFGKVKGLLNEPRSKEKGAVVLKNLVEGLSSSNRLSTLQDPLLQGIRLLGVGIGSLVVQDVLATILPLCKSLPDILKELTPKGGIVSKIVSSCTDYLSKCEGVNPNPELLKLLNTCLLNFRGTCGPYKAKLEKGLLPFLDSETEQLVRIVGGRILPLLAQIGGSGAGGGGDAHSKEWLSMVKKLMNEGWEGWNALVGDIEGESEEENPFKSETDEGGEPLLELIEDRNVFLRMTKLKRRLVNLNLTIGAFLRKPFPSPKPVPVKNLLKYIGYLISVNPAELLEKHKEGRKEVILLTGLLPSLHVSGLKILEDLMSCIGTNLLPHAVGIEQLFTQEFRWLKAQKKSRNEAYEELRTTLYSTMNKWLSITQGQTSDPKTAETWCTQLLTEITLDKETVALKMLKKNNTSKVRVKQPTMIMGTSSTGDGSSPFIEKSSGVCLKGLEVLEKLLTSLEDADVHSSIYLAVLKTYVLAYQQGSFPGQYRDANPRLKLNQLLLQLVLHPNPKSPVSLGLIINLLRDTALLDPAKKIRDFSSSSITSVLERLVHPSRVSSELPSSYTGGDSSGSTSVVDRTVAILNQLRKEQEQQALDDDDIQEEDVESIQPQMDHKGCQTELEINDNPSSESEDEEGKSSPSTSKGSSSVQEILNIVKSLQSEIKELKKTSPQKGPSKSNQEDDEEVVYIPNGVDVGGHINKRKVPSSSSSLVNGSGSSSEILQLDPTTNYNNLSLPKKSKPNEPEVEEVVIIDNNKVSTSPSKNILDSNIPPSSELVEMLNDFVDEEAS